MKLATLVLAVAVSPALMAQSHNTTVLEDSDHRPAQSLNGDWHYIVDPYATGLFTFHHEVRNDGFFINRKAKPSDTGPVEYNFATSPSLKVPGDWNTQADRLFFYEGVVWYQRDFDFKPTPGKRTFLHVGAANYQSHFWINGKAACDHEGGFTGFDCEVTPLLKAGANFIVAAVDNTRHEDGVPTLQTDWWNYGGITRDISLIDVPNTFIDSYDLHLDRGSRDKIEGWVHVVGAKAGENVTVNVPEAKLSVTVAVDAEGRAPIVLPAKGITLWAPGNPKLYKVHLATGTDALDDDIGFRTVEVRGTQILLNGEPVFLRGICIHAEAPIRTGRANTDQDVDTLLGWAKELGVNFVRLAHYPHDERMTRAADRLGIMVWSEIPVYWAIQWDNPATFARASQQLREEIARDRNKAAIVLWSMANETPNTAPRLKFLTNLATEARQLDPSRLITAALLVRGQGHTKIVDDPLGSVLDVIGTNEYIGWYEQRPESLDDTTWDIKYQKPLIMSEFGGEARAGLHGAATERWTEEYQASIYTHQLPMLNKIPQLRGMTPWLLMDFRAPARQLPGMQDYFNRKGLVSDQGEKKQAFYILQKAYKEGTVGKP